MSESDQDEDEPPSKVARKGDFNGARLRETVEGYGIKPNFESTKPLGEVNNELLMALIGMESNIASVHRIVRKLLGLEAGEEMTKEYRKFKDVAQRIKKKWLKIQKDSSQNPDEFFSFKKKAAFDVAFFNKQFEEESSEISPKSEKEPKKIEKRTVCCGSDEVIHSHADTQTAQLPPINFGTPSDLDEFFHSHCLSKLNLWKKRNWKLRKENDALKKFKNYHLKMKPKAANMRGPLKDAQLVIRQQAKSLEREKLARVRAEKERDELSLLYQNSTGSEPRRVVLKEGKFFSDQTALTAIQLKTYGVPDENVGKTMESVAQLAGVTFDCTPSPSTVRNFSVAAFAISKRHIKSCLDEMMASGESFTLGSDETTKGTTKLQAFGIHSSGGNFLCLGIDQVAEKSAQTAFESLVAQVNGLPDAPTDFFDKVVVSVQSTISDSAATEHKFNRLVEGYRRQVVPRVVENFSKMSDAEKDEVMKFSNFFCQLHVLANLTKVILKAFCEHEMMTLRVPIPDEPRVFTLIKLVSQLFCQAGSGLHQVKPKWEAWCRVAKVKPFVFESFHGNRFNIVFFLASRVYFHRKHLVEFCTLVGHEKPELLKVRGMLENPMVIAHLVVFGFCDQLITGPLWRLAENTEHVLDTCRYSLQLQSWLEDCTRFPGSFIGAGCPFPNLQETCPTTSPELLKELVDAEHSEMGLEAASLVAHCTLEYFNRAFIDFLPGGRYCNDGLVRKTTRGAPATNRNIESVFGRISNFFDFKPNMRLDLRVAYTLMSKNHTIEWLRSLPKEVQNTIVSESRDQIAALKGDAHEKNKEIEKLILQKIREKNLAAVQKLEKKASDRRVLTKEIVTLGFWQTEAEITIGLSKCKTEKRKREAVLSQLRFRQKVLEQPALFPKFYQVTANQKPVPTDTLVERIRDLQKNDEKDPASAATLDSILSDN